MDHKILITPVNTENRKKNAGSGNKRKHSAQEPRKKTVNYGAKAVKDYDDQSHLFSTKSPSAPFPRWDEGRATKRIRDEDLIGGLFAFAVADRDLLQVHTIEEVRPPADRPEDWDIPEHKKRRVLVLSRTKAELSYSKYCADHGYSVPSRCRWHVVRATEHRKWTPGYETRTKKEEK